jgi:hypothetical protein
MQNLSATGQAYILGVKQWNQIYSTMAEAAETLLSGRSWK